MSDCRSWLYQKMVGDPTLVQLLQNQGENPFADGRDAVFPGKALFNSPGKAPFIVYIMGNDTAERIGKAHRQYCLVYVHDRGNDYLVVDSIVARLKDLLDDSSPDKQYGVITAHYLETSRDLDDLEMGTICKYARFQIVSGA